MAGGDVPSYRARDYVAPVYAFNTADAGLGYQLGLLGFADDNWLDGTQSSVSDRRPSRERRSLP